MLLLPTFLAALFGTPPPPDSYRAVVVNATTTQPLAGAAILSLRTQGRALADQRGRFTLPGPVAHFRVRSLGFADLEATRPALPPEQVDTLRLLPEAILLPEASVRPARPAVLSSLGTNVAKPHGLVLVPGAQSGNLFQPAALSEEAAAPACGPGSTGCSATCPSQPARRASRAGLVLEPDQRAAPATRHPGRRAGTGQPSDGGMASPH